MSGESALREFVYNAHPGRVIFGQGRIGSLREEVERLGAKRVLALATPGHASLAERAAGLIGESCVAVYAGAAMHTPVEVTEDAMDVVRAQDIDGLVAIGGGSTIGLAKAIALRTDLPQIVIPTTYAGSEMTPIIGETSNCAKVTQTTTRVLPEVVIYDVDLTLALPARLSGTSGMNTIAHAVEALYAKDRNPVITLMAAEGVRAMSRALPIIAQDPQNVAARTEAQYGAWLCGICLGAVGMALHHKLCHTLGGTFNLPHAETHTVVLPHALAYNAPSESEAMGVLRQAIGSENPTRALYDLAGHLGAPRGLMDLGMAQAGIDEAVTRALANPYWNPRDLEVGALRTMLTRAWAGDPPGEA